MSNETYTIERWYDRNIRSWCAILRDATGNQVADAVYAYTKKEIQAVDELDFTIYPYVTN